MTVRWSELCGRSLALFGKVAEGGILGQVPPSDDAARDDLLLAALHDCTTLEVHYDIACCLPEAAAQQIDIDLKYVKRAWINVLAWELPVAVDQLVTINWLWLPGERVFCVSGQDPAGLRVKDHIGGHLPLPSI
jgi:hypothetical protein